MLPTAIIVFREVLEAALIVGIVMAASRGAPRRGLWVGGGIAAGVLGAIGVAAVAGTIAAAAEGMGQELFDAAILFAAVRMLGWHNIWMSRHGRELAEQRDAARQRRAHRRAAAMGAGVRRSAGGACAKGRRSCCSSTASRWPAKAGRWRW